jgi:DNA-binding NarL/FixJ family response regulator
MAEAVVAVAGGMLMSATSSSGRWARPLRRRHVTAPLREKLSEAELRVMRYLPSDLKAPEIAAELFVSANTVRTHVSRIYAKVGAHSRGEAVVRAREPGLLAPGGRTG